MKDWEGWGRKKKTRPRHIFSELTQRVSVSPSDLSDDNTNPPMKIPLDCPETVTQGENSQHAGEV